MKLSKNARYFFYGGIFVLISNLIIQDDWGVPLFVAMIFFIGAYTLPPLLRFMSDDKKDRFDE